MLLIVQSTWFIINDLDSIHLYLWQISKTLQYCLKVKRNINLNLILLSFIIFQFKFALCCFHFGWKNNSINHCLNNRRESWFSKHNMINVQKLQHSLSKSNSMFLKINYKILHPVFVVEQQYPCIQKSFLMPEQNLMVFVSICDRIVKP